MRVRYGSVQSKRGSTGCAIDGHGSVMVCVPIRAPHIGSVSEDMKSILLRLKSSILFLLRFSLQPCRRRKVLAAIFVPN